MRFFERNRRQLAARGISPARLPPGQYSTDRFPVLHIGEVPDYGDLSGWDLRIFGSVETPATFTWPELQDLPAEEAVVDIHCVTKWSKFDMAWRGVPFDAVVDLVRPTADATHLMLHADFGYTTNVPLADCVGRDERGQPRAMLAFAYDGHPLEPEHGYPLRFFVPHLYFWKSAKWLRAIEFLTQDEPGYWERNGYHMYGDPFREQRYSGD